MADELDAKCQLVEAEIDLDRITTLPVVLRSDGWMMQVSGSAEGSLLGLLTTVCSIR